MLIAADIGNTNIVLALHDGTSWVRTWRVYSDQRKTGDEYYVIFRSLLEDRNVDISRVDRAIVSSVVPNLTTSVQRNLKRLFDVEPLVVSHSLETGLKRDTIPSELGSDLLCNLAYAHHTHPDDDVMVVDFGTALTFSTVRRDGGVAGVAIAPGLITGVNALFGSTAQLPQTELRIPDTALGRNSEESIRAGMMYGYAGLVSAMIETSEKELGCRLFVMATGGLCRTIEPLIPRLDSVDKWHTLNGLKLISDLN